MTRLKSVIAALACYAVVVLVCGLVWTWAVAGIVAGIIFLIDIILCAISGKWKWYFLKPETTETETDKN